MTRSLALFLIIGIIALLGSCSDEDHPQAPEIPPYTGLDLESPGIAMSVGFGLAPPGTDGYSFRQLLWDGTLRVDHPGEWPPRVHEARVSDDELAAVMALAGTDPLPAIMRGDVEPDCEEPPTDISIGLYLRTDTAGYSISVLACDEDVFTDVGAALLELQQTYLPFDGND